MCAKSLVLLENKGVLDAAICIIVAFEFTLELEHLYMYQSVVYYTVAFAHLCVHQFSLASHAY